MLLPCRREIVGAVEGIEADVVLLILGCFMAAAPVIIMLTPIILPAADVQAVITGALNPGCRKLIRDHPDRVFALPVRSAAFIRDIDTSAQYSQALKSNHASAPCCG